MVHEFKPIDTAPKDGSVFLSAYFDPGNTFPETQTTRWGGSGWQFYSAANCGWDDFEDVTCWIELPEW